MLQEVMNTLMASDNQSWCTPEDIVDLIHDVAPIALDPCSNLFSKTRAVEEIWLPQDGLAVDWLREDGLVYVNPPYGRAQVKWIQKARATYEMGGNVLLCIPARLDTKVWQDVILPHATAVQMHKGRIKFAGATASAPFPSAFVLFGEKYKDRFEFVFSQHGTVLDLTNQKFHKVR